MVIHYHTCPYMGLDYYVRIPRYRYLDLVYEKRTKERPIKPSALLRCLFTWIRYTKSKTVKQHKALHTHTHTRTGNMTGSRQARKGRASLAASRYIYLAAPFHTKSGVAQSTTAKGNSKLKIQHDFGCRLQSYCIISLRGCLLCKCKCTATLTMAGRQSRHSAEPLRTGMYVYV